MQIFLMATQKAQSHYYFIIGNTWMNNELDSSLLCDCKGQTTPPEYIFIIYEYFHLRVYLKELLNILIMS